MVNELLDTNGWDKRIMRSDFINIVVACDIFSHEIPFRKSAEDTGKFDGYIYNLTSCTVDINSNSERSITVKFIVFHARDHSTKGDTYIKRDNIVDMDKFEYEGSP